MRYKQGSEWRAFMARAAVRAATPLPRSARLGSLTTDAVLTGGERCRSTRYFKQQAFEILARPDLAELDARRMLEMIRIGCSMFMYATVKGMLRPEISEPRVAKVKCKPPSEKYLARRLREAIASG